MLSAEIFKTVVDSAPLVSIDLLIENKGQYLFGKRTNRPAKGFFFSVGGRILKNETIDEALARIVQNEIGICIRFHPEFIGVFEHFYQDSNFEGVSTHYVNLAYQYTVSNIMNLPNKQHSEYKWFSVEELLNSNQIHPYVKDYFKNKKNE